MPRGRLRGSARRYEMKALRYEQLCRDTRERRRDFRAREDALAVRKATPDWTALETQLKRCQLEAEMDAMEACLEAQKPDIPILNFDLMPGFEPPITNTPKKHPDVAEQRRLTALEAEIKRAQETSTASNENSPPPSDRKNWKYDSIGDGYDPKDDWRNWE